MLCCRKSLAAEVDVDENNSIASPLAAEPNDASATNAENVADPQVAEDIPKKTKAKATKAFIKKGKGKSKLTVKKKHKASVKAKKPAAKVVKAKKTTATKGKKGPNKVTTKAPQSGKKGATKPKKAATNKTTTVKGKKNSKQVAEPDPPPEPATPPAGFDLFTRHHREFERKLARLVKVDQFGYFLDQAPPEFDERYPVTEGEAAEGADNEEMASEADKAGSTPTTSKFPSHPPFNWEMVKRRRDQGRYVLDIQKEEEDRIKSIANMVSEVGGKSPSSSGAKPVAILHPKAVHWDLFREDVLRMCNAALERNADDVGDGKPGSLIYSVKKVKKVGPFVYCMVFTSVPITHPFGYLFTKLLFDRKLN
jgi:hypothetical protein